MPVKETKPKAARGAIREAQRQALFDYIDLTDGLEVPTGGRLPKPLRDQGWTTKLLFDIVDELVEEGLVEVCSDTKETSWRSVSSVMRIQVHPLAITNRVVTMSSPSIYTPLN